MMNQSKEGIHATLSSLKDRIYLFILCLLAIVLAVPLRFTDSDHLLYTFFTLIHHLSLCVHDCIPSLLWFIISHYVSTIVYFLYFDSSSPTMCPRLYTFFTLIHHLPLCVHDCIPSLLWFIISHYASTIVYLLYFDSSSPTMCPRLRCRSDINPWMVSCIKQKNIIWTSEASVHIIFFWWRTGPYTVMIRSFGPYNIFLVTDRSIYCHMILSAMNYLLFTSGFIFLMFD
jgi:hypothetical protein